MNLIVVISVTIVKTNLKHMNNHKAKLKEMVENKGLKQTADILRLPIKRLADMLDLEYKTFEDIIFKPHPMGNGIQGVITFDNGYGASVVRTPFSYGGDRGKYELAIYHEGSICYDTHITNDVIGYLTEDEVTDFLRQIQELEKE